MIDANGEGVSIGGSDTGSCSNRNTVTRNVISNAMLGWNVYSGAQGPDCTGNAVRRNCLFAGQAESPHDENGGVLSPARNFTTTGNLIANPRYVDPDSGDYRLRKHSPCKRLLARLQRPTPPSAG